MRHLDLEIKGRRLRVPVARSGGRIWFHLDGQTYVIESTARARGTKDVKLGTPGVLVAPMPGKVTRVGAKVGESVTKGQVLVVMEAMKMEYTLEADVAGRITEVNVTPGALVQLGVTLIRINPE